jgi:uroporphyrinogen decarboxylase
VQLFDTWAGELSAADYEAFELLATQMVLSKLKAQGVPKILYAKGSSHLIESMARSGADVVSVDWQTDLAKAREKLGRRVALQGNVDPRVLLEPEPETRAAARAAVDKTGGLGHILNLGHGILPTTPVASAKAFVEAGQTAPLPARAQVAPAE